MDYMSTSELKHLKYKLILFKVTQSSEACFCQCYRKMTMLEF